MRAKMLYSIVSLCGNKRLNADDPGRVQKNGRDSLLSGGTLELIGHSDNYEQNDADRCQSANEKRNSPCIHLNDS